MQFLRILYGLTSFSFKINFFLIALFSCLVGMLEVFSIGSVIVILSQNNSDIQLFDRLLYIFELDNNFQTKIIFFGVALLLSSVLRFLLISFSILLTNTFSIHVSGKIFKSMISNIFSDSSNQRKDEFFASIIGKVSIVSNACILAMLHIVSNSIVLLFILIYTIIATSALQIGFIFGLIVYLTLINLMTKGIVRNNSTKISKHYDYLATTLREVNNALAELYLYQKLSHFYSHFIDLQTKLRRAQAENQIISALPRLSIEGLVAVSLLFFGIFYLGSSSGYQAQDLITSTGFLAFVIVRSLPILQIIQQSIVSILGNYQLVEDLNKLAAKSSVGDDILASVIENQELNKVSSISIQNLTFSYKNNKNVIEDLNFKIGDRKLLLLRGPSGSGKSTVLKVLLGTEQSYEGSIYFGEVDASTLNPNDIAKYFSYVPQKVQVFKGSLLYNVALKHNVTQEERAFALECITHAQIDVAQFSDQFHVEDTIIEDEGENLSGGQVQRIGIARALFQNRTFLVMDEPTSALDDKTEIKVFETLKALLNKNLTLEGIILVSHSQIPTKYCDEKIVLRGINGIR